MGYFNYHGATKHLIKQGKLKCYYYTKNHKGISPALVLLFNDIKHPIMPIREKRWTEYELILPKDKQADYP